MRSHAEFVVDGDKPSIAGTHRRAKFVAAALTAVATLVAWPAAHAATPVTRDAETVTAPVAKSGTKKKPAAHRFRHGWHHTSPWRPHPSAAQVRASRVQLVLQAARRLIGTPYVWAGTTPNGFDCSGFTQYVYGRAGVDLPHSAEGQYDSIKHVPLSDLQPGDLVFQGGGYKYHVGMYVGGGQMIHSPQSGESVTTAPLPGWVSAGRPLP